MNLGSNSLIQLAILLLPICAHADDLPACSSQTDQHQHCRCNVKDLHPTQIGVGELHVQQILMKDPEPGELYKHAEKRPAKILIGPDNVFYIVDGHHHARAMFELAEARRESLSTVCEIIENDSLKPAFSSDTEFWDWMKANHHARLEGADGKQHNDIFPPKDLGKMEDDPYRSL